VLRKVPSIDGADKKVDEGSGHTLSKEDAAQEQWSDIVRTQIHFNEIVYRLRQSTATVVLAAFGAAIAGFVTKPNAHVLIGGWSVQLSTPIVVVGLFFLLVGFVLDRFYYYKLLIAAVGVAEKVERSYDLPAKLSVALSAAVSRRHAWRMINVFYIGGLAIGGALILFLNYATVDLQ
jgi:hypothetical protein